MTTPDSVPPPDENFLTTDPTLKNWLTATLDQSVDASHADLQLATLKKIQEDDFAVNPDLDLACSLISGNESREDAQIQAVRAQLKKEVEQFAQEFFAHEVRNRLLLLEDLKDRCSKHAALVARLESLSLGSQIDAAAIEGLDGKVAELAILTLELFVLPQPEQAEKRRARLAEIFEDAPDGDRSAQLEWQKAAKTLREEQPLIASLDSGLLQLFESTTRRKRRSKNTSGKRMWAGRSASRQEDSSDSSSSTTWVVVGCIFLLIRLVAYVAPDSNRYSPPQDYTFTRPQYEPFSAQADSESLDKLEELIARNRERSKQNDSLKTRDTIEKLLGKEKAQDILDRLDLGGNVNPSVFVAKDEDALKKVLENLGGLPNAKISAITMQWFAPGRTGDPQVVVVGVSERARDGDPEDFASAVETIYSKFYDAAAKPPKKQRALQSRKLTEIIEIYDHFSEDGHVFSRDAVVAVQAFRRINYELRAHILVGNGDLIQSLDVLTSGIQQFPNSARLIGYRGRYLGFLKRWEESLPDLERAIELAPDTSLWFESRGYSLSMMGELDLAILDYDRAIALSPSNSAYRDARYRVVFKKKEYDTLITACDAALLLDPQDATAFKYRGMSYYTLKQYDRAKKDYLALIELRPDYPYARALLGEVYKDQRQHSLALSAYDKAIALGGKTAITFAQRGRVYMRLEDYQRSIADYSRAIAVSPETAYLWSDRAMVWDRMGETDKVITDCSQALRLDPTLATALRRRGCKFMDSHKYDQANADLLRLVKSEPEFAINWIHLGSSWRGLGHLEKSLEAYNRGISLGFSSVLAFSHRAWVNTELGRFEDGIADCNTVLSMDSENVWALVQRARCFMRVGRLDDALHDCQRLIEIEPESVDHLQALYQVYLREGRFSESLDIVKQVRLRGGSTSWTFNEDAWCRHNLEEYDKAIEVCDEGITLHPEYYHLWNTRSLLHVQRGYQARALVDVENAMELAPDVGVNHWVRGYIRREQGRFSAAIVDFDRAIEIDAGFAEAHAAKALILASCPDHSIRDVAKARLLAIRSIELTAHWSSAWGLDSMAAVFAAEGDFESAVEHVTKALEVASGVDDLDDMRARLKLYKSGKPFVMPAAASDVDVESSSEVSDD